VRSRELEEISGEVKTVIGTREKGGENMDFTFSVIREVTASTLWRIRCLFERIAPQRKYDRRGGSLMCNLRGRISWEAIKLERMAFGVRKRSTGKAARER
jgi:hypothetical protein